jgi:hypothetical protein
LRLDRDLTGRLQPFDGQGVDIGSLIWEGKPRYATLDAALQDLEEALAMYRY